MISTIELWASDRGTLLATWGKEKALQGVPVTRREAVDLVNYSGNECQAVRVVERAQ